MQKYCACHTERLLTRYMKHVRKSQSATPARQVTTRLKPSKVTTFAALGTAIAASRERLRTVADASATSSEHSETRTLAMHSGKNKTDPRVCWLQSRVAFTAVAGCGCRLNHVRSGLLQFQTQRGKVSPICPGTGIESHHSFSWKSVHMTTTPTGIQPTCF